MGLQAGKLESRLRRAQGSGASGALAAAVGAVPTPGPTGSDAFMKVSIVYDGECLVCRRIITGVRLRQRTAQLDLIDARLSPVSDIQGQDLRALDFDEGFAVVVDGEVYHGAAGARMLALLVEPTGLAAQVFRHLMTGERRSRTVYPVLRASRNLLLRILRIPRLGKLSGKRN